MDLKNNYLLQTEQFLKPPQGTTYLAFRDILTLIHTYVRGKKTLDYGCGGGRSSRLLSSYGLDVTGADIFPELIKTAQEISPEIQYILLDSPDLTSTKYDLVFSSFVTGDINSIEALCSLFHNKYKLLKPGGVAIIVTCSPWMYQKQWLTIDSNFEENKSLTSGSLTKIFCRYRKIFFHDYYWEPEIYRQALQQAKFSVLLCHSPIGDLNDPYLWVDEYNHSPYEIWVAIKYIL